MLQRLREHAVWKFFAALPRADRGLALAWWGMLLLRGVLPALFAVAMGVLVAAVQRGDRLVWPLGAVGAVFILLQVLAPLHQAVSANLGSRVAAWLYDRLTEACVRPPGMGHLEDPELTSDLTVAREFDRGMTGPPMHINMDFIAAEMVQSVVGVACAVVLLGFAWWAPLVLCGAGSRRTGSCGRAPSGGTVTRPRSARHSGTRSTPTGSPWTRRRRRSCGSSGSPTG